MNTVQKTEIVNEIWGNSPNDLRNFIYSRIPIIYTGDATEQFERFKNFINYLVYSFNSPDTKFIFFPIEMSVSNSKYFDLYNYIDSNSVKSMNPNEIDGMLETENKTIEKVAKPYFDFKLVIFQGAFALKVTRF
ncbi:MAG: hypothetical protein IT215_05515 [Chitinophagaceae bacterium]|nr:hypothetical protein [Chitinophagaceae bacterium]